MMSIGFGGLVPRRKTGEEHIPVGVCSKRWMPPLPVTQNRGLEGNKLINSSPNLPSYRGPTLLDALDQIQVPNGGKSIKSAVMKRGKQLGAVMVNGSKKFDR
ncbi:hypothetical protein FEM48_Zijuj07G0063200 [Ziziphus jujuba var. spinosa]|uniref:Uncharacterized protein n=1 Tax=Ziziphus jujuba var. spinosa TaxID=714518 RepID=A0A978V2Z3_ZIZJJ|nr:hypothetical protein FEM48_Zijuj07G0063200 [Ziziphus jujuba var. spinosa]